MLSTCTLTRVALRPDFCQPRVRRRTTPVSKSPRPFWWFPTPAVTRPSVTDLSISQVPVDEAHCVESDLKKKSCGMLSVTHWLALPQNHVCPVARCSILCCLCCGQGLLLTLKPPAVTGRLQLRCGLVFPLVLSFVIILRLFLILSIHSHVLENCFWQESHVHEIRAYGLSQQGPAGTLYLEKIATRAVGAKGRLCRHVFF